MNEKLSVYKIDTVVEHLQQALQEEVDTLLADTEFLQVSRGLEAFWGDVYSDVCQLVNLPYNACRLPWRSA